MLYGKQKQLTLMVLFLFGVFASSVWAEARYDEHNDLIRPQAKLYKEVLQSIQSDDGDQSGRAVIGDIGYVFDKDTVFATSYGNQSSLSIFKPGMTVKFYAVNQLLTKMWPASTDMAAEEPPPSLPQEPSAKAKDSTLHLEGGVWKN